MSRRLLAIAVSSAALGVTVWAAGPSFAGDVAPQMTIDPTEGPPGTVIDVEGDGCVTKGDTVVEVSLYDTENNREDQQTVDTTAEGDWSAEFTIPEDTTLYGDWRISALCEIDISQPTAAQTPELFEYDDATFTVLEPTTPTTTPPTTEPPAALPVEQEADFTG